MITRLVGPAVSWSVGEVLLPVTAGALLVLFPSALVGALSSLRSQPIRYKCVVDDIGFHVDRRLAFRWRNAVGFAHPRGPEAVLLLVGARGVPARVPLPPEPTRTALLAFVEDRLPAMAPDVAESYSVPAVFSWREVTAFTALSFVNALLLGVLAHPILRFFRFAPVAVGFVALLCCGLPAPVAAAAWTRHRYPQFGKLPAGILIVTTLFTTGLGFLLAAAFLAR